MTTVKQAAHALESGEKGPKEAKNHQEYGGAETENKQTNKQTNRKSWYHFPDWKSFI